MATITAQTITAAALTPTYSAVSASDQFLPDANGLVYHVKNGGASPDTVTISDGGNTASGNLGQSVAVSVPAAQERLIYINPSMVNPATGFVTVAHSFTTTVTAALFRGV